MAPLHADFEAVFGAPEEHFAQLAEDASNRAITDTKSAEASFTLAQFKNFQNLPFNCSPALNLIAVHPKLITLAQQALSTKDVLLYQGQAWAKYIGEADYEQPFHCNFGNHTRQPWQHVFNHASPEQLHCFVVPLPGPPY